MAVPRRIHPLHVESVAWVTERKDGRDPEAAAHFLEALRFKSDFTHAHYIEAAWHFREALRLWPDFKEARNDLGMAIQQETGRQKRGRLHGN